MIPELMCFWCMCLVANKTIVYCSPCGGGTKSEMVEMVKKHASESGHLLTIECIKPGEKPAVDWANKTGPGIFSRGDNEH